MTFKRMFFMASISMMVLLTGVWVVGFGSVGAQGPIGGEDER